jgi:hypothetical protein
MKATKKVGICIFILLAVLAGCCSAPKSSEKAAPEKYVEPDLPKEKCATLLVSKAWGELYVSHIDGKNVDVGILIGREGEVVKRLIIPGVHEILVQYLKVGGKHTERGHRLVAIDAKAGNEYIPQFKKEGDKIHVWIVEESNPDLD